MMGLTKTFLFAGGLTFLTLGGLHAALTLRDVKRPRAFIPADDALREAMQDASLRLHSDVKLWDAWMGFNLSHSFGLLIFGCATILLATSLHAAYQVSSLLQLALIAIACAYFAMALRFWFWIPAAGTAFGTALLLAAFITFRLT